MDIDVGPLISELDSPCQNKKRRLHLESVNSYSSCRVLNAVNASLPTQQSSGYFMEPSLSELATRELIDPGYCSRVKNFTAGRVGYGCVRFIDETDVRWLNLDKIIKFNRHEIVVYGDEGAKPEVGQGLNKPAEVTLIVQIEFSVNDVAYLRQIESKLKAITERQGAEFISFDPLYGEWKFVVPHFSRFGLSDDDEDDIVMGDGAGVMTDPVDVNVGDVSDIDEEPTMLDSSPLSHTLPAHLGLDPVRMREMRMLMFPPEEEDDEDSMGRAMHQKEPTIKENTRSPLLCSTKKLIQRSSPPIVRKTPLALLEYKPNNVDSSSPGTILMAQPNKVPLVKATKFEGFKLDLKHETPISSSDSRNIIDAALFMGRSFRVGWGPNGTLVHTGAPVGSTDSPRVLSSVINMEKVAIDKAVKDENNKVSEELIGYCFDSTLNLHKEINHESEEVAVGSFKIKLLKVVSDRVTLNEICRGYVDIIDKQLGVPGLSSSSRWGLFHQGMVWELISVLFSERRKGKQLDSEEANNDEDTMDDSKEDFLEPESEALPLIRRASFSHWLQECVHHQVQEEVSSLSESKYLEHIFLLLTGRQLDSAVELAVLKGDVRLACLLSEAGGSTLNRSDIAKQLDLWRINGLDFSFIEPERIRIYELLAGNIQGALEGINIDWRRFLGLLMWYQLPPTTPLPVLFRTYQQLLSDGKAPYPVPLYIEEGSVDEAVTRSTKERFDLMYYLMMLHASENNDEFIALKTMFTAYASTSDPLDYHTIWHQRAVLEAVGVFSSNDFHVCDMGLIYQLLCLGQCHWAIYVALHIPYRDDFPNLHGTLIKEILCRYCETWSTQEHQKQFIEDLGIPSAWLHEALAVYYNYCGDLPKALENFIECGSWQKAHSIFTTSVAHSLFLNGLHSEIWNPAISMEDHKSEIEDWDLGAGIYISFYVLKSSLQEDNITMSDLDNLESKNDACKDFFGRLNESLAVWGGRFSVDARVAYSKMAEEISNLLLSDSGDKSTREVQLSCFNTVFSAPVPEEVRSHHLEDAVSFFTCYLAETASY